MFGGLSKRLGFSLVRNNTPFVSTVSRSKHTFLRQSSLSVFKSERQHPTRGIEEFFDEQLKTNIEEFTKSQGQVGAKPVVTGKPWATEDLKKKSFEDLHKLWFVLVKERNLLVTEQMRWKVQPELIKEFAVNIRLKKVRKSMARIQGLLNLRKHEYHRYLALKEMKELKDKGEPIPKEMRKKYVIPRDLSEDQKRTRRIAKFTNEYKNKLKRNLQHRMQNENNKWGKRFDYSVRLNNTRLADVYEKAQAKTERRMARDPIREEKRRAEQAEMEELIAEQQAQ